MQGPDRPDNWPPGPSPRGIRARIDRRHDKTYVRIRAELEARELIARETERTRRAGRGDAPEET